MGAMTELQAINFMLTRAGHRPVNSVLDDGTNDATIAKQILDEVITQILAVGWHFNTEIMDLTPTTEGKILLSDNWLFVDTVNCSAGYNVTQRGNELYNLTDNTNIFSKALTCKVIIRYDFEDIPYHIQNYIKLAAALQYQQVVLSDPNVDAFIRDQYQRAMIEAKQTDAKIYDYNWVHSNPNSARIANRRYYRRRY